MQIKLKITMKAGLNGDRSWRKLPYSDYEVILVNDSGDEHVLREFEGYDGFMSHIRNVDQVRKEAADFLNQTARFLNIAIAEPTVIPYNGSYDV